MEKTGNEKRNIRFHSLVAALICSIVLCTAGMIHAQDLGVDNPDMQWVGMKGSYDFGDVAVGESKMTQFEFTSLGETYMWVYVIGLSPREDDIDMISPYLDEYTLGAFSFNPDSWVDTPREVAPGESFVEDVIFTPTSLSDYIAYLVIISNDSVDPPGEYAFIHLRGTGVEASVPEPATLLLLIFGLAGLMGLRRKIC